jgi:hypothetical protein
MTIIKIKNFVCISKMLTFLKSHTANLQFSFYRILNTNLLLFDMIQIEVLELKVQYNFDIKI